jgi:hypothetical protein
MGGPLKQQQKMNSPPSRPPHLPKLDPAKVVVGDSGLKRKRGIGEEEGS